MLPYSLPEKKNYYYFHCYSIESVVRDYRLL